MIYNNHQPFLKPYSHVKWFDGDTSRFSTLSHSHHRLRRSAQNPFPSTRVISRYSTEIQARAFALCCRIRWEYGGTGKVLNMSRAAGCFTAERCDGVLFCQDLRILGGQRLRSAVSKDSRGYDAENSSDNAFPLDLDFLHMLPDWLVGSLNPGMAFIFAFRKACPLPQFLALAKHS